MSEDLTQRLKASLNVYELDKRVGAVREGISWDEEHQWRHVTSYAVSFNQLAAMSHESTSLDRELAAHSDMGRKVLRREDFRRLVVVYDVYERVFVREG